MLSNISEGKLQMDAFEVGVVLLSHIAVVIIFDNAGKQSGFLYKWVESDKRLVLLESLICMDFLDQFVEWVLVIFEDDLIVDCDVGRIVEKWV